MIFYRSSQFLRRGCASSPLLLPHLSCVYKYYNENIVTILPPLARGFALLLPSIVLALQTDTRVVASLILAPIQNVDAQLQLRLQF